MKAQEIPLMPDVPAAHDWRPELNVPRVLSLSPRPASHQKTGHVGTGDQKNCYDQSEQDPGDKTHIVHLTVAQRTHLKMHFVAKLSRCQPQGVVKYRMQCRS